MSRLNRGSLLALLLAGLCALGLPAAAAAPPPDSGVLRMMHLSPDTPSVDAYIDSVSDPGVHVVLPAVGYGDVSPYQDVPAGTYTVSARAAGADPASPPVIGTTVTVAPGAAVTVAGVGHFADLAFDVLDDDLTLPPAGQARARVINAAATDSPLDLSLAAQPLASKLAFATSSDYRDVPGGAGTLTVTGGSGTPTDLPVELAAGSVYTVLVLDRDNGGLTVTTALDAASPGVVPRGGVEAGAGGTAVDPGLPPGRTAPVAWGTVVVLTLTGALALAGALRLTTVLLPVGARRSRGGRPTRHPAP